MMRRVAIMVTAVLAATGAGLLTVPAAMAQTVMQQCGQQYQAAKAGGTLGGQTWNQFRSECAARLKAQPASAPAATTPAPANPLKPAPAVVPAPAAPAPAPTTAAAPAAPPASATLDKAGKPMSAGRVAFVTRERQCGAEWRANKATLVAQTPGLKWPKYLSQCNARLKAAGQ